MNGWLAAFLALVIVGTVALSVGLFALYQKNREVKKSQ